MRERGVKSKFNWEERDKKMKQEFYNEYEEKFNESSDQVKVQPLEEKEGTISLTV